MVKTLEVRTIQDSLVNLCTVGLTITTVVVVVLYWMENSHRQVFPIQCRVRDRVQRTMRFRFVAGTWKGCRESVLSRPGSVSAPLLRDTFTGTEVGQLLMLIIVLQYKASLSPLWVQYTLIDRFKVALGQVSDGNTFIPLKIIILL